MSDKRNTKYEWYPLHELVLSVNSGLIQNPNYTTSSFLMYYYSDYGHPLYIISL
ncbi:hypothetical protein HMPREF1870_02192 [Bacteroidales bacterium KA00344]|nr:hypothetical protein HMPREF1870_02192 [Bacteroidales bacterium KA00344]